MTIKITENPMVIFDLDDTLFPEIEFLKSAFKEISTYVFEKTGFDVYDNMLKVYFQKENVFEWLIDRYKSHIPECDLNFLLNMYRNHVPTLKLVKETSGFLEKLHYRKIKMGLITDGRSTSQRNKLRALGIEYYFSDIIISEEFGSEKPNANNYLFFEKKNPGHTFYFIGDNTSKDFIIPAELGWKMICVKDNGSNIHKQDLDPSIKDIKLISSFDEIRIY
ncbi:MAG TPA: HAD family hydrolase [Chitinophagaceae bacterium]|nr:HAD family hydrolase [Chitinophagaceae bacterium]